MSELTESSTARFEYGPPRAADHSRLYSIVDNLRELCNLRGRVFRGAQADL